MGPSAAGKWEGKPPGPPGRQSSGEGEHLWSLTSQLPQSPDLGKVHGLFKNVVLQAVLPCGP